MKPGATDLTAIAATEGYRRAYFDEAAGIMRYIYANGALMELTSDGVVETALPQAQLGVERHKFAPRDDLMPRYIPTLQGHFAIDDEQLWFLAQNAYEWISILRFDRNLTPASYKVFVYPALRIMHFHLRPYN